MIANNRLGFSIIEQSVRHRCIASHSGDTAIAGFQHGSLVAP